MHLEIAPYLFLGSFIVVCVFNFIQCNICKIEDVKDYSKPSKILFWSLLTIMIYSLLATVTGLLNQQFFPNVSETTENVHTIYDNKDNAKVVYQNLDYTYEGGAESKDNLRSVLSGLTEQHNKLTVTKGTESITKAIDEDEIVGSKNGVVTKIEYGTRKHTYRPLGLPVLTTEKSFVRVHLKPKNPQDRKAIENLLEGKTK